MDIQIQKYIDKLHELKGNAEFMSEEELTSFYSHAFDCPFSNPISIPQIDLYRARMAKDVKQHEKNNISVFSYIPHRLVTNTFPSRGRMNKTGQVRFYASLSPDTNYKEINHNIKCGDEVYLSRWRIKPDTRIHLYKVTRSCNIDENADTDNCLAITNPYFTTGQWGILLKTMADLFNQTHIDENKSYLCSSFLADYILKQIGVVERNGQTYKFGYDGIIYPSARYEDSNIRNSNIVLKPQVVDEKLQVIYVIKGRVHEDLATISFDEIGFPNEEKIQWYEIKISEDDIDLNKICLDISNQANKPISDCICYDKNNKLVTEKGLKKFLTTKYRSSILHSIIENNLLKQTIGYTDIEKKEELEAINDFISYIPVEGWHDGNSSAIKGIIFNVVCKSRLVPIIQ